MANISFVGIISLCLLIPSTLALPFDFSFWGSGKTEPWGHPHWKPFPTFNASAISFPTATGSAYYPTGTGQVPTGYWKRDAAPAAELDERFFFSFPTAFPTGFPTGWPTAFPTGTATGGYPWPTETGFWKEKREVGAKKQFEGPRKEVRAWWPFPTESFNFPSFTEPTAWPTATGTGTGWAYPTATGGYFPWKG